MKNGPLAFWDSVFILGFTVISLNFSCFLKLLLRSLFQSFKSAFCVLKYLGRNRKARKRQQQSQRGRKVILRVKNLSQNVKKLTLIKKNQKKTKRKKLIKKHKMEEIHRQFWYLKIKHFKIWFKKNMSYNLVSRHSNSLIKSSTFFMRRWLQEQVWHATY